MIQSNFKYTSDMLRKINKNTTKKINLFIEIFLLAMLVGVILLIVTGNKTLGFVFAGVLVLIVISFVLTNMTVLRSNQFLLNQDINIIFNQNEMVMKAMLYREKLYDMTFDYKAITKVEQNKDFIYVYFNKKSAIVIPISSFKNSETCEKALQLLNNNYTI